MRNQGAPPSQSWRRAYPNPQWGNIVTGWSWFGTNQLGVGLHAYGFNNTLARGLVLFWLTQLAFIVVALLPLRLWRGLLWRR